MYLHLCMNVLICHYQCHSLFMCVYMNVNVKSVCGSGCLCSCVCKCMCTHIYGSSYNITAPIKKSLVPTVTRKRRNSLQKRNMMKTITHRIINTTTVRTMDWLKPYTTDISGCRQSVKVLITEDTIISMQNL